MSAIAPSPAAEGSESKQTGTTAAEATPPLAAAVIEIDVPPSQFLPVLRGSRVLPPRPPPLLSRLPFHRLFRALLLLY